MTSSPARTLDELDRQIIDILSRDARTSNRRIAGALNVTEGTIRGRIRRLEEDNCIRLTAVTNPLHSGSPGTALIGISAVRSEIKTVCQRLIAMPELCCVIMMLGRYDILCVGLFQTAEELAEVANNRILALPGVTHIETAIAAKTIKYDYRVAKITPAWKVHK